MDSKGNLMVHPAKEGENIRESKDSSGFKYIEAMISEALKRGDGSVSTIRYPWINPELGEKKPRQKIAKYGYFEPWDWIIVAGTYEGEIYKSLYTTKRFILFIVLLSIILVFFLNFGIANPGILPYRNIDAIRQILIIVEGLNVLPLFGGCSCQALRHIPGFLILDNTRRPDGYFLDLSHLAILPSKGSLNVSKILHGDG